MRLVIALTYIFQQNNFEPAKKYLDISLCIVIIMALKILKNTSIILFVLIFLIASTLVSFIPYGYASIYESGYDHGCDDAAISDPNDRYINQSEKGPSFHTNE
jgi:hypothetical protein